MASASHPYSVRASNESRDHDHTVEADGFEAAALAYAESWSPADADEICVIVRERETGREQCFCVHIGAGEAEPCA
jgi:hypothetical protein